MEWLKAIGRLVCNCALGLIKAMIVREVLRLLDRWKDPEMH
jgi:hypothetical protein